MPNFRQTRKTLLPAPFDNLIDVEEFVLLFCLNTSKNLDIEYWKYHIVDINSNGDDDVGGSKLSLYETELQNWVTQNDVTLELLTRKFL